MLEDGWWHRVRAWQRIERMANTRMELQNLIGKVVEWVVQRCPETLKGCRTM